ncbi:MAG: hypothetical protein ACTSV7_11545, partial [Candidatus Baldrarchaeia archaeon]
MKPPSFEFLQKKEHVNEMIENSISSIVNAVKQSKFDKYIWAIIVSGTLARGEGTILEKNGEVKFLSDLDLNIILKHPWDFFFFQRKIIALLENLTLPFEVSVGLSWRINTYRTIHLYEVKKTGKVIFGNPGILESITIDTPDQIPRWEGIRLLLNRLIGLIDVLTKHKIRAS